MKTNTKYIASAIALSGVMAVSTFGAAFAETVPVKFTTEATSVDVTISDSIDIHAPAGSNVADSVSDLSVKNNLTAAPIYVKGMVVSAHSGSGYTIQNYTNAATFAGYGADSKNFGIALNEKGGTALGSVVDLKTGYTGSDTVAASQTLTYGFESLVSVSSGAVSGVQIGDCVVTISLNND